MANCIEEKDLLTRGDKELIDRLERITGKVLGEGAENRPYAAALRKVLYMPEGGDPVHGMNSWIYTVLGVDMKGGQLLTHGDLTKLEVLVDSRLNAIKKAGDMADKGRFRHPAVEMLLPILPESKFKNAVINGHNLWDNTVINEARKESMISSAYGKSSKLADKIEALTGEDMTASSKEVDAAVLDLNRAQAMREFLENKKLEDNGLSTEDAQELLKSAANESAANDVLNGLRARDGSNKSAILMRGLIDMIIGDGVSLDKPGDKISYAKANDLIDTLELQTKPSELVGMAKDIRGFFRDLEPSLNEALRLSKENLGNAMRMRNFPESTINDVLEKIPDFKKRDKYFPQRVALTLMELDKTVKDVENDYMDTQDLHKLVEGVVDGPMKRQENEKAILSNYYDQNIPRVMGNYAAEIAHLLMMNRNHSEFNKALSLVQELPLGSDGRDKYQEMLERELRQMQEHLTPSSQPVRKKLSMAMIGMVAAHKMGPLNLPGMINNIAEGQTIAWSRQGAHMWKKTKQLLEGPEGTEINRILEGEFVKMIAGQEWGDNSPTSSKAERLMQLFDRDTIKQYKMIDLETNELQSMAMKGAGGVNKLSGKVTTAWRAAENYNRTRAFKIGAVMEYEKVTSQWAHRFHEMDAQTAKRYGLDHEKIKHGSEEQKAEQWDHFIKERVAKAGYNMLFGSQWLYNSMSRHRIEGVEFFGLPVGKAISTFQHYGLSWANAAYMLHGQMKGMTRSRGNLKWIVEAPSEDIRSGRARPLKGFSGPLAKAGAKTASKKAREFVLNPDAQFALSIGIMSATVASAMSAMGMTATNYLSHPAGEILQGLAKKAAGDDNSEIFFGGGIAGQLTGPIYGEVMDALSLFAFEVMGVRNRDMPQIMQDTLELGLGFDATKSSLTHGGNRNYDDALDVLNQSIGIEANTTWKKARRIGTNWNNRTDPYSRMGLLFTELAPFYPNWDAYRKKRKKKEGVTP